jgi:hypothetical protein
MALASGMAAQLGFAPEVTYGTAVTPTAFLPLVSESVTAQRERLESAGIIAGRRVLTSDQWSPGNLTVSGDVEVELYNRGLGKLFRVMFGEVATTGAGPYTHVFTPGDLAGDALTVQVGRPGTAGTVHPFTYSGMKVGSWELSCSAGEIARLKLSMVGRDETTATALASATYPATIKPLHFDHAAVTLGGSAVQVKSFTLSGDNGMDDARRFLGDERIAEPLEAGIRTYDGTLDIEFVDLTQYTRYVNATEVALSIVFTSGLDSVTLTANVRLDGETPTVSGTDLLAQSVGFKAVASGNDGTAITATLVNADATP